MGAAKKKPAKKKPAKKKPAKKKPAKKKPAKSAKPTPAKQLAKQTTPVPRLPAPDSLFAKGTLKDVPSGGLLWDIIEQVKQYSKGELAAACEAFREELDQLDDAALLRAVNEFDDAMRRAYDYNLWGAAYLIHGGCGDDTFWDFRAGVIALGKRVYEAALRDPDSLATVDDVEERTLFEGFQYIPSKLLEERNLSTPSRGGHMPGTPTGENWTDEAELETRYPRLAARFN
jgi:hypothetical protein